MHRYTATFDLGLGLISALTLALTSACLAPDDTEPLVSDTSAPTKQPIDQTADQAADQAGTQPASPQQGMLEVSPELFDLLLLWSNDADAADPSPASQANKSAPALTLDAFIRHHAPELTPEAETLIARRSGQQFKSTDCACDLIATVDANPTTLATEYDTDKEMRDFPNQNKVKEEHIWSAEAHGAAHYGEFYRYRHQGLTAHEKERQHQTQMRFHLLCRDGQGNYCAGSCSGQMYVYAEYGTRLYGWGDTNGIWDKSAHAAVADGAKLTYAAPFQTTQTLFDKAGSVSHHANQTAFNIDAAIEFVSSALQIAAAIQTSNAGGVAGIDADLVSKAITSLSKVIERSGNNGSTEREMFAAYDSTQAGYFTVNYSSSAQVHTVNLTSQAKTKNRGWGTGGDRTRYGSGYLLAVAVDYFQCGAGLTAPEPGGIWRYATTPDAPYSSVTLRDMTQSFFDVLGLNVNTQQDEGNSWEDGCVISYCQPGQCGYISNGCGGTIYCGPCTYCGDGTCNIAETCSTCSTDCGSCNIGGGDCPGEPLGADPGLGLGEVCSVLQQ